MSLGDRVAYGFGVFLIASGIIIGFSWPSIFEFIYKKKLSLSPSSETYGLWVETPVPMYLDVYLFNWTNSEEFLSNTKVKPVLEEIGPFVFKEVHQRVNVTWNANDSVSYNQTRTWSFIPEESKDLSVPIVNLNVIITTITKMASRYNKLINVLVEFLSNIYKEKLLISRPANEWLFDGMNDKLLDFVRKYVNIPYEKFGWFYGRNLSATYDGKFTINAGGRNIYDLGAMEEWNNVNKTNFYEGECGVVGGSSGELFSPMKDCQDELTIFVSDFCGPLTLKYLGPQSVEGLDGYRYVGDESVFDNGTSYPNKKCFCSGECVKSGVRNVTTCRQAPLFVSFPHFYLADPSYVDAVTGLTPNKSNHQFRLDIDPVTGMPLEVRAQLQLSVLLEPLKYFPMFKHVPKVYVPMMWFRQRAKVTPELASRGKMLRMFGKVGLWLSCGVGVLGFLIILGRFTFVKLISRGKNFELLITPEETEEQRTTDSENER